MSRPLISVILPIYNIKEYLPKCLDSIIGQTYTELEIILVDDGSTDGCADICDKYAEKESRIVVFHKKNGGLSDARNYGIERAKGEYITCVDSDDYVDVDYVEYLYKLICKYNTKMSVCQHRVVFDNGKIDEKGASGDEAMPNKLCLQRMLYHDVVDTSAWAKLYHKSLFKNVKYPKGKLFEDIATTYKLMLQCDKIAVGYESKYNYIMRSTSIVNSTFKMSKLDMLEMTDNMGRDVIKVYPDLKDAVTRRRVYARFSTLNQMIGAENVEKERNSIISFIKKYSGNIMRDPRAPKRDKAAVVLLKTGYGTYSRVWGMYLKKKKA